MCIRDRLNGDPVGPNEHNEFYCLECNDETSYNDIDSSINHALADGETNAISTIVNKNNERPTKRSRLTHTVPILFGRIRTRLGKLKTPKDIRILLDSGGSGCIIKREFVKKLRLKHDKTTEWTTAGGNFSTNARVDAEFMLPELNSQAVIKHQMHVCEGNMNLSLIHI